MLTSYAWQTKHSSKYLWILEAPIEANTYCVVWMLQKNIKKYLLYIECSKENNKFYNVLKEYILCLRGYFSQCNSYGK